MLISRWSTQDHSSRKFLDATACFSKESIRGLLKSLLAIVPGPQSQKSHLSSLANGDTWSLVLSSWHPVQMKKSTRYLVGDTSV